MLPFLSALLTHWRAVLIAAVISVAAVEGYHLAKSWDAQTALAAKAETLQNRLASITLLQASDAKRAQAAEASLTKLKAKARVTPRNTTACLPRAATERVRDIAN